jgi:uncharacterized integral membrane protein
MAIIFFAILFSMQNQEWVTLRLGLYPIENYHWEVPKVPLFLVVLCSIFFGVLIGGIGDLYRRFLLKKNFVNIRKRSKDWRKRFNLFVALVWIKLLSLIEISEKVQKSLMTPVRNR